MRKIEAFILVLVAGLVIFMNMGLANWVKGDGDDTGTGQDQVSAAEPDESTENTGLIDAAGDLVNKIVKPDSLNVLIVGLDKSKVLADIDIVAHLDTETNKVKLISVPRDLYIDFREEGFDEVKANNSHIKINYCKLTEVYSNAGRGEEGLQSMKEVISVVTGLEIDYVAAIDTGGFSEIVDIVGGVDFNVPQDMDYEDPYQDLYIHLDEGMQHLDGDKAEQLVRFRKYTGSVPPDKQRMHVQQDFLKALSKQMLAIRDFDQIKDLITTCYDMVKTDMPLLSIIRYADYVFKQDVTELLASSDMIIIPSSSERIQMGEFNPWFEVWDRDEVLQAVEEVISNEEEVETSDAEGTTSVSNESE